MNTNLPTPDVRAAVGIDAIDVLDALREYDPEVDSMDVVRSAVTEIERLHRLVAEWVHEPGPDDVDQLDLQDLRDLLTRMQHRIDVFVAERALQS